jgi:SAM-dependent methyltransferase
MSGGIGNTTEIYREAWLRHGPGPEALHYTPEGHQRRLDRLCDILPVAPTALKVLDFGCGMGDLYPLLKGRRPDTVFDYHGIDLVPEFIAHARGAHAQAHFECGNALDGGIEGRFDYVFASGLFNKAVDPGLLKKAIAWCFDHCDAGVAFDFISKNANYFVDDMLYYDPVDITSWLIAEVSPKFSLHHHFYGANVSVFVYR